MKLVRSRRYTKDDTDLTGFRNLSGLSIDSAPTPSMIIMNKEQYERIQNRENWEAARPQKLPRPTYWPFYFAMGLAFLGWSVKAGWVIAGAGLVILTIALTGWITDLRHESGKRGNNRSTTADRR